MGILADIEVILQARSARAAWQHYAGSLSDMGFVHACYFGVRSLGAEIDGGSDDSILLSTFAPQLNQDLAAQGMAPGAAPVGWLAGGYCSESWAGLQSRRRAGRLSAQQANLLDVLARYGHVAGYALRLDDSMQHARAGVLLSGHIGIRAEQIDEMWLRHGAAVETLTRLLHLKLSCLPYAPPQQVLTLRQREVLEHISIGRTVQEIARTLDLTAATVEKHLRLARKALGARTTAHAILRATGRRQIFLHPEVDEHPANDDGRPAGAPADPGREVDRQHR
ncbi:MULTISPECIES: helix-turn-helix transcriptional regulator [unclassified Paracoccus (in: a-proteobacteria)]|uniref:helix-turn-helix transcriptional regulator n=1 Tax=unclassified Paracoccus (in: a-proteobacteria) TaxID=2688777 RepID=UPI0012B3DAA3|nr:MULTISPECIES: helix-turn-helix transcriptional regulator [unclassified Paracoccus (in: a-proteobacteria)]UXU76397.1 helix-turn-helix transcriptional regulator [Paracoccus sp. SMMA_5]UXU82265.1 helix-turn-helix transcriptional regulator [Paracoccus sp. SMMA_5_TC]